MPSFVPRSLRRAWSRLRGRGVPVVYSDRYQDIPWDSPADPRRAEKIVVTLDDAGLLHSGAASEPRPASLENILRVHTTAYLRALQDPDRLGSILGTPVAVRDVPRVLDLQRLMVGGTIQASRLALRAGRPAAHLGGGFHHARAEAGMGFCVFNDVAVAIRRLQQTRGIRRAAVVDCDVHQGNGTAAIFAGDRDVFTCSLHGAKNYPFKKERSHLDVELEDGTRDEPYLEALAHCLDMVFAHAPEVIFYLAGADPYAGDRLGRLKLTINGLERRDALVLGRCRSAGLPVIITMSGGYAPDVDDIVRIHTNTIRLAASLAPVAAPAGSEAP